MLLKSVHAIRYTGLFNSVPFDSKAGSQFDRRKDLFLSIAAEGYEQELDLPLFPKFKSPGFRKKGPSLA